MPKGHYPRKSRPLRDRFWEKVIKTDPDECWEWSGGTDYDNYGMIWSAEAGTSIRASRVVWELENGPIPAGRIVCHICDNPSCVNPAHLFIGTHGDNARDRAAKGRSARHSGSKQWMAILTESDVRAIRAAFARGGVSKASLARQYGVGASNIGNIISRRSWTHI
jgi:hypothetical protein